MFSLIRPNLYHIFATGVCALGCMMLFGACSKEDDSFVTPDNQWNVSTYISLNISTLEQSTATRSNPTGGNDGDGREEGINNENKVHELTLFLYEASGDGINIEANPEVMAVYANSLNQVNAHTYKTQPILIKDMQVTANTYVIVVANAGDWTSRGIQTLSDLRNHVHQMDVYQSAASIHAYDRFMMTSATISQFTVEADGLKLGTINNPAIAAVSIQRMAARIDIVPNANWDEKYNCYEYRITDSNDRVRMTHITPLNSWKATSGQYLIKRVSNDGTSNNIIYLGDETPTSGQQTNYVISHRMADKNIGYWNSNQSDVEGWYDNPVRTAIANKEVEESNLTDGTNNYYVLDYTRENTLLQSYQLNCFSTGILIKTTYVPATIYEADGMTVDTKYTLGKTFWLLDGKFYNTAIAGATQYTDGICYYRYYIRHSNDNTIGQMGLMEFGIVRNNIYRLSISGFGRIGEPSPTPTDPTEMDEYIDIQIQVKKWAVRTHEDIIM